jgi:hypothetical protein
VSKFPLVEFSNMSFLPTSIKEKMENLQMKFSELLLDYMENGLRGMG